MFHRIPRASAICLTAGAFALSGPAGAAAIAVTVTIENLAPINFEAMYQQSVTEGNA